MANYELILKKQLDEQVNSGKNIFSDNLVKEIYEKINSLSGQTLLMVTTTVQCPAKIVGLKVVNEEFLAKNFTVQ